MAELLCSKCLECKQVCFVDGQTYCKDCWEIERYASNR